MESLIKHTNGIAVQTDLFAAPMFKESFKRFFAADQNGVLKLAFNATFEVRVCHS